MAVKAKSKKTSRQARKTSGERIHLPSSVTLLKRARVGPDLLDILDVPALRLILESITKMTNMATAILDAKGHILVATGWQDICTRFHRLNLHTSQNCTKSDLFLAKNVRPGEYVEYKCRNGLWDVVTPLFIGDKHAGNIYTGQFFYVDDKIDSDYFVNQAAKYGFNEDEYLAALQRVPRVTHEQVKNLMDFLTGFTVMVAQEGQHNLKLKKAIGSLEESFIGLIKALSATVETRDPYTALHQNRVTELAMAIALEAGLSADEADGLYMAGLIHDIGKIYVPGEVLSKPGKLSDIEYRLVRTHCDAGYKIIEGINFKRPVADIVHQHHERLDGSGYPLGLTGKDIIPEAKILAVADVVEAMASHRPYRPALGIDAALSEVKKHRGKLYDAKIVDICVILFTEKGFAFSED
ncbi:MAG: PocR ligand-binding domain-containing protein [Actinomycetota bacterium]